MRAGQVRRGRRIAPAHEGPRNESNNKAHESTSGRSTRYGSGHLIRVFRDIGHIFSLLYPSLAVFLSRFAAAQGFVALRQTFVRRCQRPQIGLLPRALDRLDVVRPAPIPIRAEPAATRRGEMVEQVGHRLVRTTRGDQVVARKCRPPIALAASDKYGLALFVGESIERLLDG